MKQLTIILLLSLVILSCTNQTPKNMETSNNEKVVKQYFTYFNHHQWEKMAGMYMENANFKDPSLGTRMVQQTRAQIIKKYTELNQVFPDINDRIVSIYPSGEKNIIVEFISTGTAPDHSKFELPICTIFTIENGLITKDFSYFDNFEEN